MARTKTRQGIVIQRSALDILGGATAPNREALIKAHKATIDATKSKIVKMDLTLDLAVIHSNYVGSLRRVKETFIKPDNAATRKEYAEWQKKTKSEDKGFDLWSISWNAKTAYAMVMDGQAAEARLDHAEALRIFEVNVKVYEAALLALGKTAEQVKALDLRNTKKD
jgi:hypothetical protein